SECKYQHDARASASAEAQAYFPRNRSGGATRIGSPMHLLALRAGIRLHLFVLRWGCRAILIDVAYNEVAHRLSAFLSPSDGWPFDAFRHPA
ncbi:MAG: hypothetical protein WD030_11730, partial [Pirellulales bacterium]